MVGDFAADGFAVLSDLAPSDAVYRLRASGIFPLGAAGQRAFSADANADIAALVAADGVLTVAASELMGSRCHPASILLFDKTPDANWAVPWHQDRTIAVKERVEVAGYGQWSRKGGVDHVEPPAELLSDMVALRLHLDDCDAANGALEVIPGSWRLGRIAVSEITGIVFSSNVRTLTVRAGDVVAMRGLTLHASKRAERPGHRRVLHVDFTSRDLSAPLAWAMTEFAA